MNNHGAVRGYARMLQWKTIVGREKKKVTGLVALGRFTPIRSEHMFILTCVGGLGEPAGNYLYHINATSFC